jgi:hypothetical protein
MRYQGDVWGGGSPTTIEELGPKSWCLRTDFVVERESNVDAVVKVK